MPEQLKDYFQRIDPVLMRPEEGAGPAPPRDFHKAWDRFSRTVFVTAPRALDRARSFRNRFIRAVEL